MNVACRVGEWDIVTIPVGHIAFVHPLAMHCGFEYQGDYLQLRSHAYGEFPRTLLLETSEWEVCSVGVVNSVYIPPPDDKQTKESLEAARYCLLSHLVTLPFLALSTFSVVCLYLTWPFLGGSYLAVCVLPVGRREVSHMQMT